jgi:predicted acylesterase/phospholipase RssA
MREEEPRLGLALSGGGFRAAFFHVGVLARLAELDLLRHVRMVSCVSGGAVTGSLYYLALLRMIEDLKDPRDLEKEEYVACVRTVREALLKPGRANVRGLVFLNLVKNLSMFLSPRYSRSDRAGDLLDRYLRRLHETKPRYRLLAKQIELKQLERPWMPRLVLNATTLNTGHNWRFRTDGMGEQIWDDTVRADVDRNDRLQWALFEEIPVEQRDFPLGLAVAAAAAFPGMFRPLPIDGLFRRYRVDLMDGGAQDNQGIQALFDERDENAFHMLVISDGSGQLSDQQRSRRDLLSVGFRVIAVEGDRIREEQLIRALQKRNPVSVVMHLRHGLPARKIPPLPQQETVQPPPAVSAVDPRVQDLLANVRTDLDAFAALESELLIADGYLIAADCLPQGSGANVGAWVSAEVAKEVTQQPSERVRRRLKAGASAIGKPWNLVWGGKVVAYALLVGILLVAASYLRRYAPDGRWAAAALALTVLALPAFVTRGGYWILRRLRPELVSRTRRRWLWLVTAGVYAGIVVAVLLLESTLLDWLEADWSTWTLLATTLGLLALPAVGPFLLTLLFLTEGWLWRAFNRVSPS